MAASDSFLSSIESFPEDLQKKLRRLRTGVFIPESCLKDVEEQYRNWLLAHHISSKSDDKLEKRIFGIETPHLSYLPEGQDCLSGFLATFQAPASSSSESEQLNFNFGSVPKSDSSVISGVGFLHPKDSFFAEHPSIKIRRSSTLGTSIEFKVGEKQYTAKESVARSLAELLRTSSRFSAEFPNIQNSLRDAIIAVSKICKGARAHAPKKPIFVPSTLKGDDGNLLVYKNLVLVFNKDFQLQDFYELRGKNFKNKVLEEIAKLKGDSKVRVFDALEICSSRSGFYLRAKVKGKYISIDTFAILELVDMVPLSNWMLAKVPARYTVQDVLTAIGGALRYADWVNMNSLSLEQKEAKDGGSRYELKYIPWTFVVSKKNSISKFVDGNVRNKPFDQRNAGKRESGSKPYNKPGARNNRSGNRSKDQRSPDQTSSNKASPTKTSPSKTSPSKTSQHNSGQSKNQ